MKWGLSERELSEIIQILKKFQQVREAVLFGSRVMGNFKPASDVDLALKGSLNFSVIAKIKSELEENTALPYFFDVVDADAVETKAFKKHIEEFGKNIYCYDSPKC